MPDLAITCCLVLLNPSQTLPTPNITASTTHLLLKAKNIPTQNIDDISLFFLWTRHYIRFKYSPDFKSKDLKDDQSNAQEEVHVVFITCSSCISLFFFNITPYSSGISSFLLNISPSLHDLFAQFSLLLTHKAVYISAAYFYYC